MNAEVIKCPSCGAGAKNHINCEYCGSLFVRFEGFSEAKAVVDDIIDSEGKIHGFIFPGLIDQIEENLSLQKEKEGFYCTEIYKKGEGECLLQIIPSSEIPDLLPKEVKPSSPGVSIHLPFKDQGNIDQEPSFKQLAESKLFHFTETKQKGFYSFSTINDYAIDLGSDSEGAAYMASKILLHVNMYGTEVTKTSELEITTSDFS